MKTAMLAHYASLNKKGGTRASEEVLEAAAEDADGELDGAMAAGAAWVQARRTQPHT